MNRIIKVLIISGFGLLLASPLTVIAKNEGVQLSPLTLQYDISPGGSQTAKILVANLNDTDFNYVLETENFSQVNDQGAPSFSNSEQQRGVSTLADWIKFDEAKDGLIASKKQKEISFTINVPAGAEPGGHYAAVFVKEKKETSPGKTEIGIASRVGTLILVTVPGEAVKSAEITDFSSPSFLWKGPADFSMRVKNTGTLHFDSTAKIEIKSMFGRSYNAAFEKGDSGKELNVHTLLPGNSRSYKARWDNKYPFGYYKVTATATDGDGGELPPITATFWALPLQIIIPVIVGLLVAILLVVYIKKHVKIALK